MGCGAHTPSHHTPSTSLSVCVWVFVTMPTSNKTALALEELEYLLKWSNNGCGDLQGLKQALVKFEKSGLQNVINTPIQKYNGRTAVHLAASEGHYEQLELLLKSGGNLYSKKYASFEY